MRYVLQILIFLISFNSFGQYFGGIEISKNNLRAWKPDSIINYSKTYHFGVTEDECELRIIIADSIVVAQTSCFAINKDKDRFIDTFSTFTNVRIIDNKFYSDQTNGEFMIYEDGNGTLSGLFVYNPWTYRFNDGGEFGSAYPDEKVYLVGDYPFASTRLLNNTELKKYKLEELKIMRNEIFARYGYIFKSHGELDKYFSEKKWYRKKYQSVDNLLTEIELKNIETIKQIEKEKTRGLKQNIN